MYLYFIGEAEEYIFYLLELDGVDRLRKLKINGMHYASKMTADKWRKKIFSVINPATCEHPRAKEALEELDKMYHEMVK